MSQNKNPKALVTGANRGLGFEITKQLAARGYAVILGVRNLDNLTDTFQKLAAAGISKDRLDAVQLDLNDEDSIKSAAQTVQDQHPDLSLLVNNAGIAGDMEKPALETTVADYQKTLAINLFGTLRVIQAFVPILKVNHGQIANLTGPFAATTWYNPAAYRVSKIALNGLIQTLAVDFINRKIPISIYGIFPGGVSTDINSHREGPYMRTAEEGGQLITDILLGDQAHNGDLIGPDGKAFSKIE